MLSTKVGLVLSTRSRHSELSLIFFASGELQSVDGYMNIALEKTEELIDGKLRRKYGDAFIRGNNGKPFSNKVPKDALSIKPIVMYISSDS